MVLSDRPYCRQAEWKKNFFTIWAGQAFSQFSSSVLQFAIIWHLTERTGSAMVLSLSMFLGFFPQAVLGPFIGVFIDRYDRKKIMVVSDLMIAMVSVGMAAADGAGMLNTELILTVLLLRAVGTAFHTPCLQAVTPQIVPAEELTRCAGYSQTLQSVSEIFSPALAALLYAHWSMGSIVLFDAAGAFIAVLTLAVSRIPKTEMPKKAEKIQVLRETAEGFQVLKQKKGIFGLVMVSALYTIALMPVSALFPLMSMSYFGGTSVQASIVEVAFSIGLLVGSLILSLWGGTKNRVYTIIASYTVMGLSLCVSGILPVSGFWGFAVCSWVMGLTGPFYWGMYTPILQSSFKDEYLGRVMTLTGSIRYLCAPIGLSMSGVLADRMGVQIWFIVAGFLTLGAACICLLVPAIRTCDSGNEKGKSDGTLLLQ